ncbi:MAG: hypothetical protein J6U22_10095 [Bacteroidaceae bacterium]|nr:hypothetical protein [Bacteroidaceae bacterium]
MSIFEVALESFIDMTKFRKRIGEKGAEKIFKLSQLAILCLYPVLTTSV